MKTRPRRGARGRRIASLALQEVGAVHARGRDLDEHLVGPRGSRFGDVTDLEDLGPAGFADDDRTHLGSVTRRSSRGDPVPG